MLLKNKKQQTLQGVSEDSMNSSELVANGNNIIITLLIFTQRIKKKWPIIMILSQATASRRHATGFSTRTPHAENHTR